LVTLENGVASFTTSSVLLSRGQHTITAVYEGDDNWNAGATASLSQTVQTTALEPDLLDPTKDALVVSGTSSNDVMYVSYSSGTGQVLVLVSGGMSYRANFDAANLAPIVLYGAAGRDLMRVSASVPVPVLMFGGDGNDSLWAGSAGSVLVGGKGNDTLQGGSGRDVLIGGLGSDNLNGQGGEDTLIGGTTDHDDDLAALELVMAEWQRTDVNFTHRYKHLLGPDHGGFAGGLNGGVYLNPATIHDDAAVDYLLGGVGTDWYFGTSSTNRDLLAARTLGEIVTYYS
jgi:Ca2+-binding RTX toxin-like protein